MQGRQLTPTEALVAGLAAAGRSNPEVAAELRLTPSVVEWHLWRVYRKLGTHSRSELAALLTPAASSTRPGGSHDNRSPKAER